MSMYQIASILCVVVALIGVIIGILYVSQHYDSWRKVGSVACLLGMISIPVFAMMEQQATSKRYDLLPNSELQYNQR